MHQIYIKPDDASLNEMIVNKRATNFRYPILIDCVYYSFYIKHNDLEKFEMTMTKNKCARTTEELPILPSSTLKRSYTCLSNMSAALDAHLPDTNANFTHMTRSAKKTERFCFLPKCFNYEPTILL